MYKYLLTMGLAALLALASPVAQAQASQRNTEIHENSKASAKGLLGMLNDLVMDGQGASRVPQGHAIDPDAVRGAGLAELALLQCYELVLQLQIPQTEVPEECQPMLNPMAMGSAGFGSELTSATSSMVLQICAWLWLSEQAPENPLQKHCETILNAYGNLDELIQQRDELRANLQMEVNVTDTHRGDYTLSSASIEGSYDACGVETRQLAPEQYEDEVCIIQREVQSRPNTCNKTLQTTVQWHCPAGAVSGPTRTRVGTLSREGAYSCEVEIPEIVHRCPSGWTGPTGGAHMCTDPASGVTRTATPVTEMRRSQRDATYTVNHRWEGNCANYEANTPAVARQLPGFAELPPMEAFDTSPDTPRCSLGAAVCSRAGGVEVINDVPVSRPCLAYEEQFTCMTNTWVNSCAVDASCTAPDQLTCTRWDNYSNPRSCTQWDATRRCRTQEAVTVQQTNCANQRFCPNGLCYDSGHEPDRDMGWVAAIFQTGAQAGRYFSANDMEVFKGYLNQCHNISTFGLFNCCDKNKLGELLYKATHIAEGMKKGGGGSSPTDENGVPMTNDKTRDFLFAADNSGSLAASVRAIDSMRGSASEVWTDLKDQDYKGVAKTIFYSGPKKLAEDIHNTLMDALTEVLTLFGLLNGCSDTDRVVAEKRKEGLCVTIGDRCETRFWPFDWCIESIRQQCCFNSLLAKIINSEGRKQILRMDPDGLGRSLFPPNTTQEERRFGAVGSANCRGFNIEQMQAIDLSQIDLTPFIATLMPKDLDTTERKGQLVASALEMFRKGCGGSEQCADGDNPFASAAAKSDDGRVEGVEETLQSVQPLLRRAFENPLQTFSQRVDNHDLRLLSKWRFHKDDIPVTATVRSLSNHPMLPNCKLMSVNLERPSVQRIIQKTHEMAPSGHWIPLPEAANVTEEVNYPGWEQIYSIYYCADGSMHGSSL